MNDKQIRNLGGRYTSIFMMALLVITVGYFSVCWGGRPTTIVLVRHADRQGNTDALSEDGTTRAQALAHGLKATIASATGIGILYLIQQQNPYEINGSVSWLSTDLRVFQIRAGQSRFGADLNAGPNQYVMDVIDHLNAGTTGESFDDIFTDQETSRLELSQTVDGTAVYNFAVARVRYRSIDSDATNVRVFFRGSAPLESVKAFYTL